MYVHVSLLLGIPALVIALLMCLTGPREERSLPPTYCWCSAYNNPISCWFYLLKAYLAGSWSVWCPSGLLHPTPYSCLPAIHAPSLYWFTGLFFPGWNTLHFPLLKFTWLILQLTTGLKKLYKLSLQSIGKVKVLQSAIHSSILSHNVWEDGTHLSPHVWPTADWKVLDIFFILKVPD